MWNDMRKKPTDAKRFCATTRWKANSALAAVAVLALTLFTTDSIAGEITLSCTDPTLNEDGTPLTDLEGIRILESNVSGGPYTLIEDVPTCAAIPVITRPAGTYYFVGRAYNTAGIESQNSGEASKVVGDTAPNPPTDLVANGNLVAYSISQSPNVFLTYPIGTVAAGAECDPDQSANGMYRVDIEDVTMPQGVQARVAFAECGQL